jgi:hypothetical protein
MLYPILPLAQIDKWREMGRDFQSDHSKLAPGLIAASLVVLAIVVVFLWILARLMNQQEGRRLFNDSKQLFRSLCRAHELSRADRRLLIQIGRIRQCVQPANLFLEPDQFDAALEQPVFHGQRLAIQKLRDRLFRSPSLGDGVAATESRTAAAKPAPAGGAVAQSS